MPVGAARFGTGERPPRGCGSGDGTRASSVYSASLPIKARACLVRGGGNQLEAVRAQRIHDRGCLACIQPRRAAWLQVPAWQRLRIAEPGRASGVAPARAGDGRTGTRPGTRRQELGRAAADAHPPDAQADVAASTQGRKPWPRSHPTSRAGETAPAGTSSEPRPDQPAGPSDHQQPVPAHGRQPRSGHVGELSVPGEDHPLRPRAHPRAGRACPRLRVLRRVRGHRQDRRRAGVQVYPRQAVPGGRQEDPAGHPLLDRHRRPRLLRGRPRSARLRGQVLHRRRQLGPRRQQPRRLLHPRRHQVPGRHPLPEAGPDDLPPGTEPHLRLHEPDARIHAHADAPVQPARHSGQLPAHGRLRRQHLQDGQRPGPRPCWSSTTSTRAAASPA